MADYASNSRQERVIPVLRLTSGSQPPCLLAVVLIVVTTEEGMRFPQTGLDARLW